MTSGVAKLHDHLDAKERTSALLSRFGVRFMRSVTLQTFSASVLSQVLAEVKIQSDDCGVTG
jgi:hypothetical protein